MDRIIFCVFLGGDLEVYQQLLPRYFPSADKTEQKSGQQQNEMKKEELESGGKKNDQRHEEGESQGTEGVSEEGKTDEQTEGVSAGEADKNDEQHEKGDTQQEETEGVFSVGIEGLFHWK